MRLTSRRLNAPVVALRLKVGRAIPVARESHSQDRSCWERVAAMFLAVRSAKPAAVVSVTIWAAYGTDWSDASVVLIRSVHRDDRYGCSVDRMDDMSRLMAEKFQDAVRAEIRAERAAQGIPRWRDLAHAVGISERTLIRYVAEGGERRDIPIDVLARLCAELGVSVLTLVERAELRLAREDG